MVIGQDKDSEMKELVRQRNVSVDCKKREEVKQKVEEYKEMKVIKAMRDQQREDLVKNQTTKARFISTEQKSRAKEREDMALEKRRLLISAKENRSRQKELRALELKEKTGRRFSGVVSKLDHETVAILGRQRDKFDPKKDTGRFADNLAGGCIRTTGRAMPSWRQGM